MLSGTISTSGAGALVVTIFRGKRTTNDFNQRSHDDGYDDEQVGCEMVKSVEWLIARKELPAKEKGRISFDTEGR